MTRTLFLNRSIADRLEARPQGIDKTPVAKLALVGKAGHKAHFACACARAGIATLVFDDDQTAAREVVEDVNRIVADAELTPEKADALTVLIKATGDRADLRDLDLLVLTGDAPDRDLSDLAADIPASALIAVSTDGMSMDTVATRNQHPERIVGWHLLDPADKAQVVEIITGDSTSESVLARIMDFARQLRKTPTVQKSSAQRFSRGCVTAFIGEGLRMLSEGVSPALIENAALHAGMPLGPLALADETSLARVDELLPAYATEGHEVLSRMLDPPGRKGKSDGAGFYDYRDEGENTLWKDLAQYFPPTPDQPDVELVKQCLLSIQALAAVRYWQAGLIDPVHADLISVLGWGYPSYTGGVLSYIDTLGLGTFIERCDHLAEKSGERFAPSTWLREQAKQSDRVYPKAS